MALKKVENLITEINKGNPFQAKTESRMVLITLSDFMYEYLDNVCESKDVSLEDILSVACFERIQDIVVDIIKKKMRTYGENVSKSS